MPARHSAEAPRLNAAADWKQMASPHGYDQAEFPPSQSSRDYKRAKPHEPDEERRRLRNADAAMEKPQAAASSPEADAPWDTELDGTPEDGRSRLYRE